jgi:hypothetical protein
VLSDVGWREIRQVLDRSQILELLDRIYDLLQRSLPMNAVALITPDANESTKKQAGPIQGFKRD